jgi:glycerol uptake facilitator-like aquaporin
MIQAKRLKQYAAQCLAELFGTFILVFIGNLAVAQAKLSDPPVKDGFGPNLAFATGVYVALMIAGPISG